MYRQSEAAEMENQSFCGRVGDFPLYRDVLIQINQVYEMAQSKPFLSMGVKAGEAGLSIASKVASPLVKRLPGMFCVKKEHWFLLGFLCSPITSVCSVPSPVSTFAIQI